MDRSTKQKISKKTQALNDTVDQLHIVDIYRTFHPKTMNFTFFSSAHRNFSRIDHILGHKSSLGKFKKIEIISSVFSDHNAARLDINKLESRFLGEISITSDMQMTPPLWQKLKNLTAF